MKLTEYGADWRSYRFDGKHTVEITLQFHRSVLGWCIGTCDARYRGTILPDGTIHWDEHGRDVPDGIEGLLNDIHAKQLSKRLRKQRAERVRAQHDTPTTPGQLP